MQKKHKKYHVFQRIGRVFKLNFLKLLRSPGGAKKVSLGFAIGFGLEMLVISTASLIYLLFIPIVRLAKGSLPAAIIGNIIGKISFLPVILLPIAKIIGKTIFPMKFRHGHLVPFSLQNLLHGDFHGLTSLLLGEVHVIIGMAIIGTMFGFISYFIVHYFYEKERIKRLKKRNRNKKAVPPVILTKNMI